MLSCFGSTQCANSIFCVLQMCAASLVLFKGAFDGALQAINVQLVVI